ncbi:uncharacterized protein O3C94_020799 [Discoglossus pictus]
MKKPDDVQAPTICHRAGDFLTNIEPTSVTVSSFQLSYKENIGFSFNIALNVEMSCSEHKDFSIKIDIEATIKVDVIGGEIKSSLISPVTTRVEYLNYNFPDGYEDVTNVLLVNIRRDLENSVMYTLNAVLITSVDKRYKEINERTLIRKEEGCVYEMDRVIITNDSCWISLHYNLIGDGATTVCDHASDENFLNTVFGFVSFEWTYTTEATAITTLIPSLTDIVSGNSINFHLVPTKIPHCTRNENAVSLSLDLRGDYSSDSKIFLWIRIVAEIEIVVSRVSDKLQFEFSDPSEECLRISVSSYVSGCNCADAATALRDNIIDMVNIYILNIKQNIDNAVDLSLPPPIGPTIEDTTKVTLTVEIIDEN